MINRLRRRWVLPGAALLVVLSTACMQLGPVAWPRLAGTGPSVGVDPADAVGTATALSATDQVMPAATATSAPAGQAGRQTVAVRLGSISQQLTLTGRVAGVEEIPVKFPTAARVESVSVVPGQTVEEGQPLLDADRKEIQKDLDAARARVEVSEVRLSQAQAQMQARQRDAERQADAERVRRQAAVGEAEAGLRRAQANLEQVKAGAPASTRRAAEAEVMSARSGLERAKADLARLSAGPSQTELNAADQQVWSARLALQRAQADYERLQRGPDPADLRAAQLEVTNAQTALDRSTVELDRLVAGDPTTVTAAEREVQRAQLTLRAAQDTRVVSSSGGGKDKGAKDAERNARVARDAAIASAQLALKDAQDRLNVARQGPPPSEVALARRNMQAAQEALQNARERYQTVAKGPDELALATANQAVQSAKAAVDSAESHSLELKAGPPADHLNEAKNAVASAQTALIGATERLAEVNSHPTSAELSAAQDGVALASTAVDRAQADLSALDAPSDGTPDSGSFDLVVLEKGLQQDRAAASSLEQDLTATRLVAPFAGVVAAVLVRPGDQIEPGRAVIVLAKGGAPIVRVDLSDSDAALVTPGQSATAQIDGVAGVQFESTVAAIEGGDSPAPTARLNIDWGAASPSLGASAQVIITVQQKDDVLIVPQRAIRAAGARRYVELVDSTGGTSRRTADVQVGIVAGGDAEILSGLTVGQLIVMGP